MDTYQAAQERRKQQEKEAADLAQSHAKARDDRERKFKMKQEARRRVEAAEQQADLDAVVRAEQADQQRIKAAQAQRSLAGLTPVQANLAKERWAHEDREVETNAVLRRSTHERKWRQRTADRQALEAKEQAEFTRAEEALRQEEDAKVKGSRRTSGIFGNLNKFQSNA